MSGAITMSLAENYSGTRGIVSSTLEPNRYFIAFIAAHAVLAFATGLEFDMAMVRRLTFLFLTLVPTFLIVMIFWHFGKLALVVKPEKPIRRMSMDIMSVLLDRERMVSGVLSITLIVLFFGAFSFFKDAIPSINHFSWDVAFAEFDRMIHFGIDPWLLTWAVFGSPFATTALNAAYHAWFFLLYFVVFYACFTSPKDRDRNVFLLAFVLTWAIVGNAMALGMSSAGPVYFERLGLGDTFEPLMAQLWQSSGVSPVWALNVQDLLWEGYTNDGPISGISAMPSMHVASSVLLAFYCWRLSRLAGVLAIVFAVFIQIGSVHLAWHYAIDGYVGAAATACIWFLTDRLIPRASR